MSLLSKLFGDANKREVESCMGIVHAINQLEKKLVSLDDDSLRHEFTRIRSDISKDSKKLDELLPDVFAIVRESAKRAIGQRHFDVQLIGGIVLHRGKITEMKTGEGKTLVATLAAVLNACAGRGVHVITVNDYLSRRDAQWMGRIYDFLGLSVGVIQHEAAFAYAENEVSKEATYEHLRPISRKEAYQCDITYGTNNEFGFDYLRDNMAPSLEYTVQRSLSFAIIDEVDSILIDEARTPLIISSPDMASSGKYSEFSRYVEQLNEGQDYNVDEKMRAVAFTEEGVRKMEKALRIDNIYTTGGMETVHHIEQALRAKALFKRDKDYVVKDGEIVIVDEFTGRLMFGRRFSEGLHQALEAKEGVEVKSESQTLATITFQNFFRMYKKLSGMTGTAATESEEFSKIYNIDVVIVPTNREMVRKDLSDRIYKSEKGKFMSVVQEVKLRHEAGQPVLVGTISIEKNELLSQMLTQEGIPHEVLNAKNHAREANIIANAGKRGAVTIATNMAGRGVDIILGGKDASKEEHEEIVKIGGLFVMGTERHESRRIDNQLRGRSGRQGDPGMSQFYVSLEDDLLRIFGSERLQGMMTRLGVPEDMPIENSFISKSIESAQKKVEGHNFDIRKHLVEYDDVINKHRETMYKIRGTILESETKPEGIKERMIKLVSEEIEKIVTFHTAAERTDEWNIDEIYETVDTIFTSPIDVRLSIDEIIKKSDKGMHHQSAIRDALISYLNGVAQKQYTQFEQKIGDLKTVRRIEQSLYLRVIDTLWIEHLSLMDYLRQGIGLRGYGQRDPLIEYKKESYKLFSELIENIRHKIVYTIFKIQPQPQQSTQTQAVPYHNVSFSSPQMSESRRVANSTSSHSISDSKNPSAAKIGRNDPCWCGSGKKYKKCHGA